MKFRLNAFWKFCSELKINTKEYGTIKLSKPFGPQRWFMRELARGLDDDVHNFTVLKSRQIGLSTISLALDLYWPFTHPGMDCTVIVHDDKAHTSFRTQLDEYYNQLPKAWKPLKVTHNRQEFSFRTPSGKISRIQYQIAGTRASGGGALGRSKGNAYCHGTELSSWGDEEGLMSLRASLAENNPNRLYIWESTARGFNRFYDVWKEAQDSVSQRAIFVSWWAHELYFIPKEDQRFKVYFGDEGELTREEQEAERDIIAQYGDVVEFVWGERRLRPEQWAWYRWYGAERVSDETILQQEMPHDAERAFIVSGATFFRGIHLAKAYKRIEREMHPQYLKVQVKQHFLETTVVEAPKKASNLTIWAGPVEGAWYVLGADPAYGSSDWADRFVISVWRAYADRLEQVAEFCDAGVMPYSFAWILCYLAGSYGNCYWNLEVNGPGAAVLQEIDQLKRESFFARAPGAKSLRNFTSGMREFYWKRVDQISGSPSARGTKSTYQEKELYMNCYRDYFARGIAVPHSYALIDEMKGITKEPGKAPAAAGRAKDDRVIGAALATHMWHQKMIMNLMRAGVSYERTGPESEKNPNGRVDRNVVQALAERKARLMGIKLGS